MEKESYVPEPETKEREILIKSEADLAKALGLTKNTVDNDNTYRVYQKPLDTGEVISLNFQTGKYGGTQIIIGIRRNAEAQMHYSDLYLNNQPEIFTPMLAAGISRIVDSRFFVTKELKDPKKSGYARLYKLIEENKNTGLYQKLFEN